MSHYLAVAMEARVLAADAWGRPVELSERAVRVGNLNLVVRQGGAGPSVVLVHGFPDTARTWDRLAPDLIGAGYRVVAPYLRGTWPSSCPPDRQVGVEMLARDLVALLDALDLGQVALVGHDWGAITVQLVAARHPERVRCVVTMAVPHLGPLIGSWQGLGLTVRQLRRSWYVGLFQLPGAGWVLRRRDAALVERLWREWSPTCDPDPDLVLAARHVLGQPEAARATLALYRGLRRLLWASPSRRAALLPVGVPTLALHGEDDGCMGAELAPVGAAGHTGPFELELIEGAGHFVHLDQHETVRDRLLAWLHLHHSDAPAHGTRRSR